ncbi:MAG TPA: hypothetical protein VG271_18235, partial [Beijerinckiaceae bacterium]|nr:hypothetical protein [Beijerinckiaceae bacterium]
ILECNNVHHRYASFLSSAVLTLRSDKSSVSTATQATVGAAAKALSKKILTGQNNIAITIIPIFQDEQFKRACETYMAFGNQQYLWRQVALLRSAPRVLMCRRTAGALAAR